MITVSIDEEKLRRSLELAAKKFGDTTAQAVSRMAVQVARENAVSTQPYGVGGTRKKMMDSIEAGTRAVVVGLKGVRRRGATTVSGIWDGRRVTWPKHRFLSDPESVVKYVDSKRLPKTGRTRTVRRPQNLAAASETVLRKAIRARKVRAGMAKGGWISARMAAARFQRGGQRLTIGKNFLGWTHKAGAGKGAARRGGSKMNPTVTIYNRAIHSPAVIKRSEIRKNTQWAARKTISWYRRALRASLK